MKFRLIAALIFFVIPGLSYISADVYRWTDAKGTVSYGNQPPADARDLKLMFKEDATPNDTGQSAQDNAGDDPASIPPEPAQEVTSDKQTQGQSGAVTRKGPSNPQDEIAQEKARLEKKIAELEAQPLDYFGSQKNKRLRLGYFRNRLETLETDPEAYFANPEVFEGNVKNPEKNQ